MSDVMLPLVAGLAVTAGLVVMSLSILSFRQQAGVRRSLALVVRTTQPVGGGGALLPTPPEGWGRALLDSCGRALVLPANRRWVRRQLTRAGRLGADDLRRVLDEKLALSLLGLLVGVLGVLALGGAGWVLLVVTTLVGYFLPDLLAFNAGLKRTEDIRTSLPDALDLLDLCVESGLSLQAAMAKVAEVQQGPVAEECARVLQEMRLGVSRKDALNALVDRSTQNDLRQLVAAILQAESLGIPVAGVLREQAREMRARRSVRAREAAQKVPVKILAPLMLCFLPGLFIIILGPAAITVVQWLTAR